MLGKYTFVKFSAQFQRKGVGIFLVYENIKEICKKKGIAITEVESKANLARGSIFKWKESSPTAKNLKAVADVLNVKVDTLLKE